MERTSFKKYVYNCFLLILPVLAWNVALTGSLPEAYQPKTFLDNIPVHITYGENIFRILIFAFTLFMPLMVGTNVQKQGLIIYIGGILLYFTSWLMLIYAPDSDWSKSIYGFMAPAYTPLFWLLGIGLIGDNSYFHFPYKRIFFILFSILFLIFHNWHTFIVYSRLH
jgi:hypothetical protein